MKDIIGNEIDIKPQQNINIAKGSKKRIQGVIKFHTMLKTAKFNYD